MKEVRTLNIGAAIFLIALGAILKYAVTASVAGVSLSTVGVILMIAGFVGLVASILMARSNARDSAGVPPRRAA